MTSVLAVVGPTASGKTAFAIELAERLNTEIVSADSMQFYRGMEIGTAAPTPDEQARVKHHFVGFLNPDEHFSAGRFQREARTVVAALNAQEKVAVVVGGSGLYVHALIDGLFPGPGKDDPIRARLHAAAQEGGVPALYAHLQRVDPDYAAAINPRDLRRIVRALEVYEISSKPLSVLHREHREKTQLRDVVQVAFDYPRDELYARINARTDRIMAEGFLDEVRTLMDQGYARHLERLRSLGYREMMAYLRGECAREEAIELMKRNTRRFAKRQLTWFRADARIHWLPTPLGQSWREHTGSVLAWIDAISA